MKEPKEIVAMMMEKDYFSQWMGLEIMDLGPGYCTLRMSVTRDMLNGFAILHGGVSYAMADSALAFASNSHGIKAVSTSVNMSYPAPAKEGDILTAVARELSLTRSTGIYDITVSNTDGKDVGLMRGSVFRTGKEW